MESAAMIEKLSLFGLSRQEATIYLCLLQNGELTGYEVAKLTGISRSNVYSGMATLVEHGAAYAMEGVPNKYLAVSLKEFSENYIRYLQDVQTYLILNEPKKIISTERYITIEGERHICDKIHNMLLSAEKRIYFSATSCFLERWQSEIRILMERKIKVVLISDKLPAILEGRKPEDGIIFYQLSTQKDREGDFWDKEKQIRLIIDSEFVLTGEIAGSVNDTCLYSAQKNFVATIKDAMRNEIELIKIRSEKEE